MTDTHTIAISLTPEQARLVERTLSVRRHQLFNEDRDTYDERDALIQIERLIDFILFQKTNK